MVPKEQVLVIPAHCVTQAGFTSIQKFQLISTQLSGVLLHPSNFSWMQREDAEQNPQWKQIIPYVVVHHNSQTLYYTRGVSGGEARLHQKRSLGFGGHITPADGTLENPNLIRSAAWRELTEEIILDAEKSHVYQIGYLYDPSDAVGEVHLGVVFGCAARSQIMFQRESHITETLWGSVADIQRQRHEFESWSQILIDVMAKTLTTTSSGTTRLTT